jgi:diguanylate cyclase (GGDEF)-like protein/PAS domain S-box-containing protein
MLQRSSVVEGRQSSFPWRDASGLAVLTGALYVVLPTFAPDSVTGTMDVLLLGVVLGIVVGLAVRLDGRVAPVAAVSAFLAVSARFLASGSPPDAILPIAALIGLEVWVMTFLVRRSGAWRLDRPQDVLILVGISLATGLAAGAVAGGILEVTGTQADTFEHVVRSWAIDDVFGLVCIAPALMTLHRPSSWSWRFAVEYSIVCAVSAGVLFAIFRIVPPGQPGLIGWPYLILLGPLWIAIRLGVAAVTPLTAVTTWFAVSSTVDSYGAFSLASANPVDRLVAVDLFCIVLAITLLMVAVLRDSRARSMSQLRESSRLFEEVVDGAGALVFAKSFDEGTGGHGRYVLVNRAWEEEIGLASDETLGRSDEELFGAELADAYLVMDRQVLESNAAVKGEERGVSAGGDLRYFSSSKFPLRAEDGHPWGVGGIASDTTDLVHALERERRQGNLLRAVFELSPTPAMRLTLAADGSVEVLDVNTAMCALMAADEGDATDCDLRTHLHPDDAATAMDVLSHASRTPMTRGVVRKREIRMLTNDDREVWTLMSAAVVGSESDAESVELVAQFEDFTARRLAEEALSDQALRDPVTGLPNRRALHDRLESALNRLRRSPGMIVVLFCDLDHFKDVNDTLGHQAGDELLVHVARRMQSALRPEDTVARLGGDEFVALGERIVDPAAAMQMAMRLQDHVKGPWIQGDRGYRPSVSIGVAIVDEPDVTADEVLRRADLAMYRAKENGRSRVEIYDRDVDERYQNAVAMQHDLRRAIDTGSLVLHYQPIVGLVGEQIVGAEALVRMPGRDGELRYPFAFIPQAETSGLIVPMGAWVVRRAIEQLALWRALGRQITVSVNVSPSQLRDEGFASFVLSQIEAADVDPQYLAVEVTETALLNEPDRSARELNALSGYGVGIYLDDFGTGYSSLSWLTQFPVDIVKIDKSFTDELGIDERKTAIVSALIQVSHELGFSVVAEGIETTAQSKRLIELGCDRGQGFLFGHPVPPDVEPWG